MRLGDAIISFQLGLHMRLKQRGMSTLASILAFSLTVGLATPALAQNLVVNGSFEADPCTTPHGVPGERLGLSGSDMSGWYIPSTDGTYPWCLQNTNQYLAGPAADGNQWLVLGRANTGTHYTIQQTLSGLTSGGVYNLGFSIASENGCCSLAEVSFLSGSSTPFQMFTAPTSGEFWTQWGAESMNFVASSPSVTFQFRDLSTDGFGQDLGLDAVSVEGLTSTSTPEPASLALLATGLFGLVPIMRRKLRK